MTEQEFADSIDCKFPYRDEAAWKRAMETASAISANACFIALEEVCRVPKGRRVSKRDRRRMLEYWQARCDHPLKEIVLPFAIALIEDRTIPLPEAFEGIRAAAQYPGQYAAMNIVYFSCDDEDGEADALYKAVVARWETAS